MNTIQAAYNLATKKKSKEKSLEELDHILQLCLDIRHWWTNSEWEEFIVDMIASVIGGTKPGENKGNTKGSITTGKRGRTESDKGHKAMQEDEVPATSSSKEVEEGTEIGQPRKEIEETTKEDEKFEEDKDDEVILGEHGVTFVHQVKKRRNNGTYSGSLSIAGIEWSSTFIPVKNRLRHLKSLTDICSTHKSLLTVKSILDIPGAVDKYMVTEFVDTLEDYFRSKWETYALDKPVSKEEWWTHIATDFRLIFRSIICGLGFLFHMKIACGDVHFNSYVNEDRKGKIIPSYETSSEINDLQQLVALMKSLISYPFGGSGFKEDEYSLPQELKHFFLMIKNFSSAPATLLVNHPYFWVVEENAGFIQNLRTLTSMDPIFRNMLEQQIDRIDPFPNWGTKLPKGSMYGAIYSRAEKKNDANPYRSPSDIIRYVRNVLVHANEKEYFSYNKGIISQPDIVKYLHGLYPEFYTIIFGKICYLSINRSDAYGRTFDVENLKFISIRERFEASSGADFLPTMNDPMHV